MKNRDHGPPPQCSCSVYIALSVDGYIARPDGGIDWLSVVSVENEDYGYKEFFSSVDTVVIGRRTYDTALGFSEWPYIGKRCVVLTNTSALSRNGEEFASTPPSPLLLRLQAEGSHRVYIDGGVVIRDFLAAGAIDDMTLSVIPILLGAGVRLFESGAGHSLRLQRAQTFNSGLVQLHYRVADAVAVL